MKRKRSSGWGWRKRIRKKREEEGRRGKIELLTESFLLADQGQGQTQLLFIKRRVLPRRTPCC